MNVCTICIPIHPVNAELFGRITENFDLLAAHQKSQGTMNICTKPSGQFLQNLEPRKVEQNIKYSDLSRVYFIIHYNTCPKLEKSNSSIKITLFLYTFSQQGRSKPVALSHTMAAPV